MNTREHRSWQIAAACYFQTRQGENRTRVEHEHEDIQANSKAKTER